MALTDDGADSGASLLAARSQNAQNLVEPFRRLADTIPHVVWITSLHPERVIYVSPSFEHTWGRSPQELYDDPRVWTQAIHPEDRAGVERTFVEWISGNNPNCQLLEYRVVQPSGDVRWIRDYGVVTFDAGGRPMRVSGVSIDLTELKRAELEHLAHLWFLASLDKVNQAIQRNDVLERMTHDVLEQVLQIFDCDRAWLVFPCNPQSSSWRLAAEHTRPAYTTGFESGVDRVADPALVALFRDVMDQSSVMQVGSGAERALPPELSERFGVHALLCAPVHPKVGTSYVFGLHQCAGPRTWTEQEQQLFREIGRRLADALSTLSTIRSLLESEARLDAAQRHAHVGYWNLHLETQLITWSEETFRIYGLPSQPGPLPMRDVREHIHPADRRILEGALARAIDGNGHYEVEYRAIPPSAELRYLHSEGHVVRDASGKASSLFGTVRDVTARKRTAQLSSAQHTVTKLLAEAPTLEEAMPRILKAICESVSWDFAALWRVDFAADALRCSEVWRVASVAAPRFEAATRDGTFAINVGLPGRVWSTRKPWFVRDITESNSPRSTIAAFEGFHAAFGFPILVGAEVWGVMEFLSQEIRQTEQDLLDTMATLGSQIGQFVERKRAETALHDARAELAHVTRVASLGELTASIAHEVNQPLTGIIANAHAALRWLGREPPELREAVEAIQRLARDGKRAGEVVARLRTLVRKGEETRKVSLDINQVVKESLPLIRSDIQHNQVATRLDLEPDLPPVFADRVQLQQVILNLIMNAVEAMSPVLDRPRELVIRTTERAPNAVAVSIRDTGIGLAPDSLDRIFDAFYTTKPHGMGMGLAISRSIVEDHRGRLGASSAEGAGSTFQFTLPTDRNG